MFRRLFCLNADAGGSAGGSAPAAPATSGAAPTPAAGASGSSGASGAPSSAKAPNAADPKASGAPKTYRIKVDGQELELSEAEVVNYASLGKAGHKRMAEAAEARRKAEAFIEKARKNPLEALLDPSLGLTKDQVREQFEHWYKTNVIDEEQLTPEQKKLRDYEHKLKEYEEKDAKEKETKEAEQRKAIESKYQDHYQKQIMTTLDKSGLPKTAKTVGRFAFYMAEAIRDGVEVPMDVIADKVREDYQGELRSFTQAASAEVLLQFLGKDVAKKIRDHDLAELLKKRNGGAPPATPPTGGEPEEKEKPKRARRETWTSIRRNLGR